jgi:hypothetical protein
MPEEEKIKTDPVVDHNQTIIEWKTPEFIPMPRGRQWYLVASAIIISLVAYAIFTDSATMAIVFILLAGLFFMTHKQAPRMLTAKLTKLGVGYDKAFYPYNMINAFWVVYHPPYVRSLYLRIANGKSYQYLKIELNYQDPTVVRNILTREIPEIEGMGERMIDIFTRVLRLQ